MHARRSTFLRLRNSEPFRRFSKAFEGITGMPVFLLEASSIDELMEEVQVTHPICSLVANSPMACCRCRRFIAASLETANASGREVITRRCPYGLWATVIPVFTESEAIFLYSGRVLLERRGRFKDPRKDFLDYLKDFAAPKLIGSARDAASRIQVLNPRIYAADVEMLRLLKRYMRMIASRLELEVGHTTVRSPFVRRAQKLIDQRHDEPLHLDQIARELHVNRHYLSHMFHDQTGSTFTQYLAETRVEALARLLAESECTITEAAFAAGFQSLSQANRVFHAQTGQSPRAFRKAIVS